MSCAPGGGFVTAAMERYGTTGSIGVRAGDLPAPVAIRPGSSLRLGGRARRGPQAAAQAGGQGVAYAHLVASPAGFAEDTDSSAEIAADIEVSDRPGRRGRIQHPWSGMLARAGAVRDSSATFTLRPSFRPSAGLAHDVERVREVSPRIGLGDRSTDPGAVGLGSDKRLSPSMSRRRRKQATLLRKSFEAADRKRGEWGVHAVNLVGVAGPSTEPRAATGCRKSGLLKRLGRPKPSYGASKALARGSDPSRAKGARSGAWRAQRRFWGRPSPEPNQRTPTRTAWCAPASGM